MTSQFERNRFVIHPGKFSLWLFIISIILFFGGLTSAYIVLKGIELSKTPPRWLSFELPTLLYYNTAVLIVSSVTIQWSAWLSKRKDFSRAKIGLILTLLLGGFFLVGQYVAYTQLHEQGVMFADSNAGSFFYVLTGAHGFHIIAGVVFLLVVLFKTKEEKVISGESVAFENAATFWHFLGLLWLYLYLFIEYTQKL